MLRDYCSLALFLVAVMLHCELTNALCADETDCSARCYTEVWRRQLCVFYAELRDWRLTAARCGLELSLHEIEWDQSQPASVQWEAARSVWLQMRQTWRDSTVTEDDNTADDGSASGVYDLLDDTVENVELVGSGGDLVEVWRREQSDWSDELTLWRSLVGDTGSKGEGPTFDPRNLWRENLSNWADDFATYNTTFYDLCTP